MTVRHRDQHTSSTTAYALSNSNPAAPGRFSALSTLFDSATIRHLQACGLREGWNCLEVGGGGGSITAWIADRVGPTGRVSVTDIDPRFLTGFSSPTVEVRQHNIVTDPLSDSSFDLIHARLVLIHIAEREQVLARLVAALKPGGWLVEEEFDSASLLPDSSLFPGESFLDTQKAAMRLLDDHQVDRRWGRRLFAHMRALGLEDVRAEAHLSMWHGGSSGTALMRANFDELRSAILGAGYVTSQQFDADAARLEDPSFVTPAPIMWTVCGRRPAPLT